MDKLTPDSIIAALEQLERSERGHAAAVQMRRFLEADDGYALGLDQNNWHALVTLFRACERGMGYAVRDALPKK